MKSIFIASSKPGNARPDYFKALAHAFAEKGFKVYFIIDGAHKELPKDSAIEYLSWPNKRPTGFKDFIFLLKNILQKKPAILISSFGAVTLMNICGILLGVKNRWNYVLSVSELFSTSDRISKMHEIKKWRKKQIYNLATLLVPNSEGTKKDVTAYYKLKNRNSLILPNLIKDTAREYVPLVERRKQFLMVGNLIPLKGQIHIIRQMPSVLNHFSEYRLLIVGSGPDEAKLKTEVDALSLKDNVAFIGRVPYGSIQDYFASSILHISASENEAFGFVNIEALREGTPIIATKSAGALSIIDEDNNGEFINIEEEDFLIEAIKKILNNWSAYSSNARQIFTEKYKLETNIFNHRDMLMKNFK